MLSMSIWHSSLNAFDMVYVGPGRQDGHDASLQTNAAW